VYGVRVVTNWDQVESADKKVARSAETIKRSTNKLDDLEVKTDEEEKEQESSDNVDVKAFEVSVGNIFCECAISSDYFCVTMCKNCDRKRTALLLTRSN
jgi:hypothetical protein